MPILNTALAGRFFLREEDVARDEDVSFLRSTMRPTMRGIPKLQGRLLLRGLLAFGRRSSSVAVESSPNEMPALDATVIQRPSVGPVPPPVALTAGFHPLPRPHFRPSAVRSNVAARTRA